MTQDPGVRMYVFIRYLPLVREKGYFYKNHRVYKYGAPDSGFRIISTYVVVDG
jgi:hypothetical protein